MFILFHENVYFKLGSASKVFSKRTPSMVILSWMAFKVAGITSGVNLSSMVDKYPRARPEWYTNLTSALGISRTSWRTRVSVIIPDVSDLEIKIKLIGGKKIGFGFVLSRFSGQGPQKPKNFGKKPKHFGIRKPQHFRQGSLKTRNISVQELWEPKYFRFKNPQNPKISGLFRFLHILVKSCSYQDQGFYIQNLKIQKKRVRSRTLRNPKTRKSRVGSASAHIRIGVFRSRTQKPQKFWVKFRVYFGFFAHSTWKVIEIPASMRLPLWASWCCSRGCRKPWRCCCSPYRCSWSWT